MRNCLSKLALSLMIFFVCTSCSSVFNPYSSKFQCPETYKGKCVSVKQAYDESFEENANNPLVREDKGKKNKESKKKKAEKEKKSKNTPEYSYRKALYEKLSSLMREPTTPLVIPPKVMRVLILPYTEKGNNLLTQHYIYFFATEPRWAISSFKEKE